MNRLESAELNLRRAHDEFNAAKQEVAAMQQGNNGEQMALAPQSPTGQKPIAVDLDKVQTVEDCVALLKILGTQIMVDKNHAAFDTVEHLVVDDADTETAEG